MSAELDGNRPPCKSRRVTRFRPCIDLHNGQVKQIIGGSLTDNQQDLKTNFVSPHPPKWFAELYRRDNLPGGHVIKLGPGNDEAAKEALRAWPSGMQLGGGITLDNAGEWLDAGASHVIVTSYLFDNEGSFVEQRLKDLVCAIGADRLVIDLSCRRTAAGWTVAMNRWQTLTSLPVTIDTLDMLAEYCAEFLIHAADVEGLCSGIDLDLVAMLGQWGKRPMTYAGGVHHLDDLETINRLSNGNIDATVGSALDIFGGKLVKYSDLVERERSLT